MLLPTEKTYKVKRALQFNLRSDGE